MFILFFGTRPGKTKTTPLRNISCPFCGKTDTLSAQVTPHYFHLFWLPVFRVSTHQTAHCVHCKRGFYKEEFTPEMEKALKEADGG